MWRDALAPQSLSKAADRDRLVKVRVIFARVGEMLGIA